MSTANNNWIFQKNPEVSTKDKLDILLKMKDKLVLVQTHELERIKNISNKNNYVGYIDSLYKHYVTLGLPKTYLT